jgi:type IV secretory pathway protease TraF
VTKLVAVEPPERLAFLSERGYLPRGVPMLKRLLALPGQKVCRDGLTITVDDIALRGARAR